MSNVADYRIAIFILLNHFLALFVDSRALVTWNVCFHILFTFLILKNMMFCVESSFLSDSIKQTKAKMFGVGRYASYHTPTLLAEQHYLHQRATL